MRETNNSSNKAISMKVGKSYTILAGIGHIDYQTQNLQLQLLMEALEDRLKKSSPREVIDLLSS